MKVTKMKPQDASYGLTQDRLRELLTYDSETGVFRWTKRFSTKIPKDLSAGIVYPRGYIAIRVDGRRYQAHRLAWFYVHGVWPENDVDHINGEKGDNRIANLRLATRSENLSNRGPRLKPRKYQKGVYQIKTAGKVYGYGVQIKSGDKRMKFGCYETPEEAHEMYCEAAVMLHGEFASFY